MVAYRSLILAVVELLEIEFTRSGFTRPQTEVVGGRGLVAGNGRIVCLSLDDLTTLPDCFVLAIVVPEWSEAASQERKLALTGISEHSHRIGSRQSHHDEGTPTG